MKRVVLTGGAGFIGSCFLTKLNDCGIERIILVDNLTSEKEKNIEGKKFLDFVHKEDFIDKVVKHPGYFDEIDTVFHFGACSSTLNLDVDYLEKNNTQYSIDLAKWCAGKEIKLIYASSAATYGNGENGFDDDIDKLETLKPLNPYGMSKHRFDLWVKNEGLFKYFTGLKFFNVFGPNEYHKGEMRSLINKAFPVLKEKGVVYLFKSYKKEYGDGEQKRDFIYIKDVIDVVYFFFEKKNISGLFNVGKGKADTWNDVAKAMFKALNIPENIVYIDMPEELKKRYQYFTEANIDKLREAGYRKSFTNIYDAIKDYLTAYLNTDNPYF